MTTRSRATFAVINLCPLYMAGARGFAAGLTPRLLTIVPGNMIAWLTYEKVKQALV